MEPGSRSSRSLIKNATLPPGKNGESSFRQTTSQSVFQRATARLFPWRKLRIATVLDRRRSGHQLIGAAVASGALWPMRAFAIGERRTGQDVEARAWRGPCQLVAVGSQLGGVDGGAA